jgi:hypothetical protein
MGEGGFGTAAVEVEGLWGGTSEDWEEEEECWGCVRSVIGMEDCLGDLVGEGTASVISTLEEVGAKGAGEGGEAGG